MKQLGRGRHEFEKSDAALSRRSILSGMAYMFAAGALPRAARALDSHTEQQTSPTMSALSAYMANARQRALPDEVMEKAKQHILDTFAAMISGSQLPPGAAALKFAKAYSGETACTVVASKIQCGAIEAAFTNGMLAHSDETDDSNAAALSHPGCSIVPAAFATGEQFMVDGPRFLRAVALGYDIGPRVTIALGGTAYQTETHRSSHAIAGVFGAAAAAGSCATLSEQQMRWLLDYATQQTSGIAAWQRDTEHIEKGFVFAGMPARNGVTAALLVRAGWTGVDDILSGPDNFFSAFAPHADPAGLVDQLGKRFEIARTNIKKWTVGSPIQAPLDAMQALISQHALTPDKVQSIVVRVATQEALVVNNREMPDICLQQMVAVMLMDGTVSFHSAHDVARMKDPATLRQRAKVTLIPDQELDLLLPRREAIVEITLADGTHLSQRVEAVRGTYQDPMTWDEVLAKSRDLITPVLGASTCARLLERMRSLEKTRDIRELRGLLQA